MFQLIISGNLSIKLYVTLIYFIFIYTFLKYINGIRINNLMQLLKKA